MEDEINMLHHYHKTKANQCTSIITSRIKAPVNLVWSLVRRFDQPQNYNPFVSKCIMAGEIMIGSIREVKLKSGLPATISTERLEVLDDEEHIFGFTIVGGDYRLENYSSIMTLHPVVLDGRQGTLVIESFIVDVPEGNTDDETIYFVKALLSANLRTLRNVCEKMEMEGSNNFL